MRAKTRYTRLRWTLLRTYRVLRHTLVSKILAPRAETTRCHRLCCGSN
jgi:hypothetical protein